MITFSHKGNFDKMERFLKGYGKLNFKRLLESFGQEGVNALSAATPLDTGLTASSWRYEVTISSGSFSISWLNTNVQNGVPIAIILQYGHGTGTGGYVQGRDYINPAIRPIFDKIADEIWKEVGSL